MTIVTRIHNGMRN